MLPMLSEAAVNSGYCRKEITFALSVGKPFLPVCLEEIVLPSKLQFLLCNVQFMFAYRYPDTAAFLDALCRLEVLAPCRSVQHAEALLGQARQLFAQLMYDEAFALLTQAAEAECAEAQFELAERYHYGKNCPVDLEAAADWYHRAAQNGHAKAQFELGMCYFSGEGVPRDEEVAFFWMEQGDPVQFANNLFFLALGLSASGQFDAALRYMTKAAEAGDVNAQYMLGMWLLSADETADREAAVGWLQKAAAQGSSEAAEELKRLGIVC